jgi:hypothetical protein
LCESRNRKIPAFETCLVRTARLLGTASAAASCRFFHLHLFLDRFNRFLGLFLGFFVNRFRGFRSLFRLFINDVGRLFYGFFSATCAGLGASGAASRGMRGRHGHAAGTYQSGDSKTGEEFLQVLAVHTLSSL